MPGLCLLSKLTTSTGCLKLPSNLYPDLLLLEQEEKKNHKELSNQVTDKTCEYPNITTKQTPRALDTTMGHLSFFHRSIHAVSTTIVGVLMEAEEEQSVRQDFQIYTGNHIFSS